MNQIAQEIANYTAENSNFDTKRDYIGMSNAGMKTEDIIRQMNQPMEDNLPIRLKCYKGYQMEKDLIARMKAIYGDRIQPATEITAYDGKVKGHPDFEFDGLPADCKSVARDEWMPKDGKLPRRVYYQMQAYLKYSGKPKALVIYESRESGIIENFWINPNQAVMKEIENRMEEVIEATALK